MDLCGQTTRAEGFVALDYYEKDKKNVKFSHRKSGVLHAGRDGDHLLLDFPIAIFSTASIPVLIQNALGAKPIEVYKGLDDYMIVVGSEEEVLNLKPDFKMLMGLDARGIIVTAEGEKVDFVSRFFAPEAGINEDPVSGSAHTILIPYWAQKMGKKKLTAFQASKRGGELSCELIGNRVKIGGKAHLFLKGEITLQRVFLFFQCYF